MKKVKMLKIAIFLSLALSIICLSIILITEARARKKMPSCIEFDLNGESLSDEAPAGLRCESSRAGEKVHVTCCTK